jgi:hypothetical protein
MLQQLWYQEQFVADGVFFNFMSSKYCADLRDISWISTGYKEEQNV